MLENRNALLPLAVGKQVYVLGFDASSVREAGYVVIDGNAKDRPPVPPSTDALLIKIQVSNPGARAYSSKDVSTGGQPVGVDSVLLDPRTGKQQATWGAQDPCVYEPDKPRLRIH